MNLRTFNAAFVAALFAGGISALCLLAASREIRFVDMWDSWDAFMALGYAGIALMGACLIVMVREMFRVR